MTAWKVCRLSFSLEVAVPAWGAIKPCCRSANRNLLQVALDKAREVSPVTVIVGASERYSSYGDTIEDQLPGCGPLGGIHAALCATQNDLNLVLSVDTPLMTAAFLTWLVGLAKAGPEWAFVPEAQQRPQPLCAVYRRAARPVIEQALKARDFKVSNIFSLIPTRYITEREQVVAGFSPDIFCNVNTPEEYEAFSRRYSQVQAAAGQSR